MYVFEPFQWDAIQEGFMPFPHMGGTDPVPGAWLDTNTYASGDACIRAGKEYISIKDSNRDDPLSNYVGLSPSLYPLNKNSWILKGTSEYNKMIDIYSSYGTHAQATGHTYLAMLALHKLLPEYPTGYMEDYSVSSFDILCCGLTFNGSGDAGGHNKLNLYRFKLPATQDSSEFYDLPWNTTFLPYRDLVESYSLSGVTDDNAEVWLSDPLRKRPKKSFLIRPSSLFYRYPLASITTEGAYKYSKVTQIEIDAYGWDYELDVHPGGIFHEWDTNGLYAEGIFVGKWVKVGKTQWSDLGTSSSANNQISVTSIGQTVTSFVRSAHKVSAEIMVTPQEGRSIIEEAARVYNYLLARRGTVMFFYLENNIEMSSGEAKELEHSSLTRGYVSTVRLSEVAEGYAKFKMEITTLQ